MVTYVIFVLVLTSNLCIISCSSQKEGSVCSGVLKLDLPVRYLHIQLTREGRNITFSPGIISAIISGDCRFRQEIIDNFDGSYVLRLKLWSACQKLNISIFSPSGVPVCDSPIIVEKEYGALLVPENCDCAKVDVGTWLNDAGCAKNEQLEKDIKQWQLIDFHKVLQKVENSWGSDENKYIVIVMVLILNFDALLTIF